jgi:hypothetical protein
MAEYRGLYVIAGWVSLTMSEPYRFAIQVYNVLMVKRYPYWVYVVGVFVAWAIVLLFTWRLASTDRFHKVFIFGCGFLLGVLAASLARKVYK